MAHLIETELGDRIFSRVGTEWHGLAEHVEGPITRELVEMPLLWPILQGKKVSVEVDGVHVPLEERQVILADFRGRTDLAEDLRELRPLHVPTNQYYPISNGAIWDQLEEAFPALGAEVVSVGTLRGGKTFIVSLGLVGDGDLSICGTSYRRHLNVSTGHDGQLCLPHLSMVRMICANTERMSLESAEAVERIKHTISAEAKLPELGKMFERMLGLTEAFKANNEALAELKMSEGKMREFAAGYFAVEMNVKHGSPLAKRSRNAADEIVNLAFNGRGTSGKTAYDLACGATEYYSEGNGSGRKTRTAWDKMNNSLFGAAMDHKTNFVRLLSDRKTREETGKAGKSVLAAESLIA